MILGITITVEDSTSQEWCDSIVNVATLVLRTVRLLGNLFRCEQEVPHFTKAEVMMWADSSPPHNGVSAYLFPTLIFPIKTENTYFCIAEVCQ